MRNAFSSPRIRGMSWRMRAFVRFLLSFFTQSFFFLFLILPHSFNLTFLWWSHHTFPLCKCNIYTHLTSHIQFYKIHYMRQTTCIMRVWIYTNQWIYHINEYKRYTVYPKTDSSYWTNRCEGICNDDENMHKPILLVQL